MGTLETKEGKRMKTIFAIFVVLSGINLLVDGASVNKKQEGPGNDFPAGPITNAKLAKLENFIKNVGKHLAQEEKERLMLGWAHQLTTDGAGLGSDPNPNEPDA